MQISDESDYCISDVEIIDHFRPASEVDGDILWQIIGGIVQSNAEYLKSTDMFQLECTSRIRTCNLWNTGFKRYRLSYLTFL